jgi:tetratricopeptide (TPR) repeat protein/serine/threonine protein kinase
LPPTENLAAPARPERAVPGYEILGELGRGGMGVVYQARQLQLNRLVALKMILAGGHTGPEDLARFRREAEAVARLHHPNIIQIHEVGEQDGLPYFSLELCAGGSLADHLDGTPWPGGEAAPLVESLARAMQHAHEHGIVHRDLKPANILLQEDGPQKGTKNTKKENKSAEPRDSGPAPPSSSPFASFVPFCGQFTPKITDFGLAKRLDVAAGQTRTGAVLGTPSYMAPEQALGDKKRVGPAADVYALGALLYELLTGRPPFRAETAVDTLLQVVTEDPVPPARLNRKVPRDLETICLKCLEKLPGRRYASALALAEDLRRFQANEPITARPVSRLERARKWVRRNQGAAAFIAALVVLVAGAGAAGLWLQAERVSRATEQALRQEYLNKEVGQALDEAAARHTELHHILSDPKQVHELLSDIDRWRALLQEARAAWRRARSLAHGSRELLSAALAHRLDDLEQGLAADEKDLTLARELDDIRLRASTLVEGKWDPRRGVKRYPGVFARAGLPILTRPAEAVAAQLARSPIRAVLVAAVDHWAVETTDGPLAARLLEVARRADPHPWRNRLRDPKVRADRHELKRLARELQFEEASPQVIVALGQLLTSQGGDAAPVLRRALVHHPRDFWLYFHLGGLARDPALRVGYYRAAVATRPQSGPARYNLGVALRERKDLEGAEAEYRKAIRLDPDNAQAHNNLGLTLSDQKDSDGAIAEFRKAIQLDARLPQAHYNLGSALFERKDREGAIAEFRIAIRLNPNDARAHYNLGFALHDKKDLEGAVAAYRTAIRLDPRLPQAAYGLGNVLTDRKDWKGAVAAYRAAIRLNPKDAQAHCNLGVALREQQDLAGAVAEFRLAMRLDPKLAQPHTNLGNALRDRKDLEGAIAEYREAIRLDPHNASAHYNLGDLLYDQKDLEGAVAELRTAVRLAPDLVRAHFNLGKALRDGKDLDGAVAAFRTVTRLEPNNAQAHVTLGIALAAQKDPDGAIAAFRRAIQLDPNDAGAHYNLGVAFGEKKDLEGAIRQFQIASRLDPRLTIAHYNLGNALRDRKDLAGAAAAYQQAIQLDPHHVEAHLGLGNALYERKDLEGAIAAFRKTIQLHPRHPQAPYNFGIALYGKKDLEGAIAHYRLAIQNDPHNAVAHGALTEALLAAGRFAEARQSARQFLQMLPNNHPQRPLGQRLLQQCGVLLGLERKLAGFLAGGGEPQDVKERLALAFVCRRYKHHHAAAARLYGGALAAQPSLADDPEKVERYNAACSAALAAAGQGLDPRKPDPQEKARLRGQALQWLRADLDLFARHLESGRGKSVLLLILRLSEWKQCPDLAGIREPKALAGLPGPEQAAWRKLWAEVDALLKRARAGITETHHQGTLTTQKREQLHTLKLAPGTIYLIDLHSTAFDTHLKLLDSKGRLVLQNHNPAPNVLDSRLIMTAAREDTSGIVAASFQGWGRGAYTLTIRAIRGKTK